MNNLLKTTSTAFTILTGALLISGPAAAQGSFVEPIQVLGTVEVYCPTCALDMKFDEPDRMGDFELLFEEPGADFISCVRVPAGDFLCLDRSDKTLKKFPGSSTTLDDVFSCEDSALDLNTRKATTCTAYTFGLDAHFLAGQNNGKTFSLQRIFEEAGCAESHTLTSGLCTEELYTGRPLLLDIKAIQDDVADNFPYGPGVIGIEQRSETAFFPVPAVSEPVVIASKKDWGLKGKKTLQSVDLLQITNPVTELPDNYAVVTTSDATILALKIGGSSGSIVTFDIASVPLLIRPPEECDPDEQHYGLKVDEKTDLAIVTDRNCRQAFALKASLDVIYDVTGNITGGTGELVGFELFTETVMNSDEPPTPTTSDLILSTGAFNPIGPTTSPGKSFDLDDCETDGSCTFTLGATLQDVVVAGTESGVTVFQAKNVPFCPYKPLACVELLDPNFNPDNPPTREEAIYYLLGVGVLDRVRGSTSGYRPEEFAFNTTPVLPKEILDRFDDSGLPPLWMLPDFRAQIKNNFFFEALFFVTEARTNDVLTMELDVNELSGRSAEDEVICETVADLGPNFVANADGLDQLLRWDVVTRASERDPTIDNLLLSLEGDNFQGTISNAGCGSSRIRGGGLSMFPYNLEASGCPGTLDTNGNLVFDYFNQYGDLPPTPPTCVLGDRQSDPNSYDEFGELVSAEIPDDAVFAKAYVRYYDELRAHLQELVCPISMPILALNDCVSLDNNWLNGKDKLVKALDATIDPKVSAGAQNFGAVQAQLNNYQAALAQAEPIPRPDPPGPDPVNRLGEHAARIETLQHILNDKLAPSVPTGGFVESDRTWAE